MSKEAKAYHRKWIGDKKDLRDRYEVMQDYAEKYHKGQVISGMFSDVSQRYTIEDIERCVENWGLCKVEKEYIEKFLNGCKRLNN